MFFTYVLESAQNSELYIGYTANLHKRLREHNRGQELSTRRGAPWRLIYYEACLHEKDTKRREQYFKTSQGRRLLKRRLKEYFYSKRRRA